MEYITEVFKLDKKFPFTVFKGKGFSAEFVKSGKVYMHNHYCLEPDSAKLTPQPLPKSPKIWYNRSIRKAEKQHRKGEEENA